MAMLGWMSGKSAGTVASRLAISSWLAVSQGEHCRIPICRNPGNGKQTQPSRRLSETTRQRSMGAFRAAFRSAEATERRAESHTGVGVLPCEATGLDGLRLAMVRAGAGRPMARDLRAAGRLPAIRPGGAERAVDRARLERVPPASVECKIANRLCTG